MASFLANHSITVVPIMQNTDFVSYFVLHYIAQVVMLFKMLFSYLHIIFSVLFMLIRAEQIKDPVRFG